MKVEFNDYLFDIGLVIEQSLTTMGASLLTALRKLSDIHMKRLPFRYKHDFRKIPQKREEEAFRILPEFTMNNALLHPLEGSLFRVWKKWSRLIFARFHNPWYSFMQDGSHVGESRSGFRCVLGDRAHRILCVDRSMHFPSR